MSPKEHKDHFNKAVFEMFGVGQGGESVPSDTQPSAAPTVAAEKPTVVPAAEPVKAAPAAEIAVKPVSTATEAVTKRITYIAPESYMEGTLRASGDVEVAGDFKGSLSATGNVTIHANIVSDISAARLSLLSCSMRGNAQVTGAVIIDEKSSLEGDITAEQLICAGRIKGNVRITGKAAFQSSSCVEGDIAVGSMSMECGALISGSLNTGSKGQRK